MTVIQNPEEVLIEAARLACQDTSQSKQTPTICPRYGSSPVAPVANAIINHHLLHLALYIHLSSDFFSCEMICRPPSPFLIQLPIHRLSPSWPEPPHSPDDNAARHRDTAYAGKQPPVANRIDQRLRNDSSHTGEDIPHKVIHRDAVGCLFGHELREHGRSHGKYEHGADAEEEVCNQRDQPENPLFGGPAVPNECGRVEEGGDPGVLAHAVFRYIHQFSLFIIAASTLCFSRHDLVGPFATKEGREHVADGVGDVGESDEGGGEFIGRLGEDGLERYVEEI